MIKLPGDNGAASPRLSIITVVRNDAVGLQRTLASVSRWKGGRTEYLIIDGASTDGTLQVVEAYRALVDHLLSEPDNGIYDAMNKGIALARGDFLLFLNAGDELLVDPEELLDGCGDTTVLVYGRANMRNPDGSLSYVKGKRLKSNFRFFKGMPLCHQAILYRREAMVPFDTAFRIMADRVSTWQLLRRYGLRRSRFVDRIMVNYYEGGFSGSLPPSVWQEEEDRFYRLAGVPWYRYKKQVNRLFKERVRIPLKRLLKRD
ncbi:glycosyltransferase family 2 protein [Trichlorobacter ammonificans]|uniref:Glycosyltransferase, WfgS-like family n=1 Tax=Trichlorobacter ammonificans TaxID=2916410 RepID=A0ABM9D7W6_9BACT|nr:glycosyltransferase family 2 protein [Trichlorobacter ammonificans]CAH2030477.1 Glycosyltransferase, WfgS-like family [Trichlorobacter ammonificans]